MKFFSTTLTAVVVAVVVALLVALPSPAAATTTATFQEAPKRLRCLTGESEHAVTSTRKRFKTTFKMTFCDDPEADTCALIQTIKQIGKNYRRLRQGVCTSQQECQETIVKHDDQHHRSIHCYTSVNELKRSNRPELKNDKCRTNDGRRGRCVDPDVGCGNRANGVLLPGDCKSNISLCCTTASLITGPRSCSWPDRRAGVCTSQRKCDKWGRQSPALPTSSILDRCPGHPDDTVCCTHQPSPSTTPDEDTCAFGDGRTGLCVQKSECVGSMQRGRCPHHADVVRCCTGDAPPIITPRLACTFNDGRDGTCRETSQCQGAVEFNRCPHLGVSETCCDNDNGSHAPPSLATLCDTACRTQWSGGKDAARRHCARLCAHTSLSDASTSCLPDSVRFVSKITNALMTDFMSCSLGQALQQGGASCTHMCTLSFGQQNTLLDVSVCTAVCEETQGRTLANHEYHGADATCIHKCREMTTAPCMRGCALGVGVVLGRDGVTIPKATSSADDNSNDTRR